MANSSLNQQHSAKDWFELGLKYEGVENYTAALNAYRSSLKLSSQFSAPWLGLARVLDANSQFEDARQCLLRAVQADPGSTIVREKLAAAHKNLGFVDEALIEYKSALAIDPKSSSLYFGIGQLFEDIGSPLDAAHAYRKASVLSPQKYEALACTLGLGRHLNIDHEISKAAQLVSSLNLRDRALVAYGLGKALEHQKKYHEAFNAFQIANDARIANTSRFNREQFDKKIDALIELFSPAFFKRRHGWGNQSQQAVFIVGLPRSGTTLTEQILASHNQCFGAGELNLLTDLATGTPDRIADKELPWPMSALSLSQKDSEEIGNEYCAASSQHCDIQALRIVDKQPLNFWHIGLIAMALPNARIIHCTRDIRDCGLSIFTQNFGVQQTWSTDLSDIAYYWRGYQKLMAHWEKVTSLSFLNVCYEDTVSDLDKQARRLLDFVDLPWSEDVLQFHKSKRAVQTPSRWQVRQPIYQSAKARWRHYESYLEPLSKEIDR